MTLKLTPARLDLLQAVDDAAVHTKYPILPSSPYVVHDRGPDTERRFRRVDSRIGELETAGLVRLGARVGSHYKDPRQWDLTDAGRAALAEATGGAP